MELRQVARSNARGRKSADQVRAHLEMIEHSQATVQSRNLSALQMHGGDDVRHHFVIGRDVALVRTNLRRRQRRRSPPEFGQCPGRRISLLSSVLCVSV